MSKLRYLIYKDSLLLVRDIAGMLLMFLMPVVLVILMSLLQDSTLNSVRDAKVKILLVNKDTGELGKAVESEIYGTGIFDVSKDIEGVVPTIEQLEKAVASNSDFVLGIFIPENTTEEIRLNVAKYVSAAFNGVETTAEHIPVDFTVYIDPTTKSSFNSTVMSTLKEKA
ncbi:hypothetical protein SDC9_166437 [bioreactor metagenome]|uniref:ABC transporter permease n=1 Tax=bioreactor metagenome TaxID=1076179 RepID=A0A645FWX4_9ZZZZ